MLYLNYLPAETPKTGTVELYLFDPNGVHENMKAVRDEIQRGWSAVVAVWRADDVLNKAIQLKDDLTPLGGVGVQTQLGETLDCMGKDKGSHRCNRLGPGIYMVGDPICAAVTYWMFSEWVAIKPDTHRYTRYPDFEKDMINEILKDDDSKNKAKHKLHQYIADMRRMIENEYHDRLRTILMKDMKALTTLSTTTNNGTTVTASDFTQLSFSVVLEHRNPLLSTSMLVQFDGTQYVLLMSASEQCGNQLAKTPTVGCLEMRRRLGEMLWPTELSTMSEEGWCRKGFIPCSDAKRLLEQASGS